MTITQGGGSEIGSKAPARMIHLILNGFVICSTPRREGGRQTVTTRGVFRTLYDDERCERCAAALRQLERSVNPPLAAPPPEVMDPGTVRLGDSSITAKFPPLTAKGTK